MFIMVMPFSVFALDFEYVYDALNRLVRVIDSEGNVVTYNYDEVGNILSIDRSTVANLPPPTLDSATPDQVNQGDPATIVLTGSSLLGGIVSSATPGITVKQFFGDATQITVHLDVASATPLGLAELMVSNSGGSASIPLNVAPPRPRITSVVPNQGPSLGETLVTITGSRFIAETTVSIGGSPATDVVLIDSSTLTAKTPIGPSEQPPVSVDVVVTNPTDSATLSEGYTYISGINFGETISGVINIAGDVHQYAFNGNAGDVVRVRMSDASPLNSTLNNRVEVFDAMGNMVGTATGEANAILDVTLPTMGPYLIRASDASGEAIGSYRLSVQRLNNPGQALPVAFGETVAAAIDPQGDLDSYTFIGMAGDVVRVRMSDASTLNSTLNNRVEVFDSLGALIGTITDERSAVLDVTLPTDGPYLILASDASGEAIRDYRLSVQRLNNPGQALPVAFGETVAATIDLQGELDSYTFTGMVGDVVRVRMSDASTLNSTLNNRVEVFDPLGALIGTITHETSAVLDVTLPIDGPYLILASDASGEAIRDYRLSVQRLNNPGQALPVAFGETVAATIDLQGELDSYIFTATAGDVVRVRMSDASPLNSTLNNRVEVFDPLGALIGSATDESQAILDVLLPTTGPYLILASDASGEAIRGYGLSLERLNNPGNATPMGYGETVAAAIDAVAELDAYTFTATAGDVVRVRMSDMSNSQSTINNRIELFDPSGIAVGTTTSETTALLDVTLPANGDYLLLASDASGDTAGGYGLSLQRLNNPGNATSLTLGDMVNGAISALGEWDAFTFTANAGDNIRISITRTSGNFDPTLETYFFDGSSIGDCSDATTGALLEVSCLLNNTGDYSIIVSDSGGNETGNYSLTLTLELVVPNLAGLDQATAEANVIAAGFVVGIVTTAAHDTVPAGSVINQLPSPGELVPEGSAIDLTISSGPPSSIPSAVGFYLLTGSATTTGCQDPADNTIAFPITAEVHITHQTDASFIGTIVMFTPIGEMTGSVEGTIDPAGDFLGTFETIATGNRTTGTFSGNLTGSSISLAVDGQDVEGDSCNTTSDDLEGFLETPNTTEPRIVASLSPSSQSVQVGSPGNFSVTIFNTGSSTATACGFSPLTNIPADFSYQTSDPFTGAVTGTPNTPVDIPADQSQTFVGELTPTAPIPPTTVLFVFDCTNTPPALSTTGVNTLDLTASVTPVPNILATATTLQGDGIVHVNSMGTSFSVAALNVGVGGTITVTANTGGANVPISFTVCETNISNDCVAPPSSSSTKFMGESEGSTFEIFVQSTTNEPFNPARIFVQFTDSGGILRGSTSVLVVPSGLPPVNVPDVQGLAQADAETALIGAGLVLGTVAMAAHDTVPAGSVISQVPVAGTLGQPGSTIDLIISTGPPPNVVGTFTGGGTLSLDNCQDANFNVTDQAFTSTITVTNPLNETFSGTGVHTTTVASLSIRDEITFTGTVTSTGDLNITGTNEFFVDDVLDSSGEFTATGSLVGDTIDLIFNGLDTVGDTCTSTGTINATR